MPTGSWHELLLPSHWSRVQGLPSSGQAVPGGWFASAGQVALVPVQFSATSHTPAEARQTVLEDRKLSVGQLALDPSHVSATSHTPAEARQTVLEDRKLSVGQLALDPSHVSATSHTPAEARHTAPALPAGCWHVVLVPSHTSRVQGLPSSVQAAPALPAGCWQAGEPTVPLHTSVVQGLPSSVQLVPADFTASAGHVALEPVQVSARSHPFTALRQTFELGWKVQLFLQQEEPLPFIALPRSHCSPVSTTPLPQML